MSANIYVQKRQENKTSKKERNRFLTLSKMDNQKAHTEADKERRGQFKGKVSPPATN